MSIERRLEKLEALEGGRCRFVAVVGGGEKPNPGDVVYVVRIDERGVVTCERKRFDATAKQKP